MDSSDNSSVSSDLSDCNYDDDDSEHDISIVNNENFSCGYVGEQFQNPEPFLVTVKMKATTGEDDDLNSSRQEKLY